MKFFDRLFKRNRETAAPVFSPKERPVLIAKASTNPGRKASAKRKLKRKVAQSSRRKNR